MLQHFKNFGSPKQRLENMSTPPMNAVCGKWQMPSPLYRDLLGSEKFMSFARLIRNIDFICEFDGVLMDTPMFALRVRQVSSGWVTLNKYMLQILRFYQHCTPFVLDLPGDNLRAPYETVADDIAVLQTYNMVKVCHWIDVFFSRVSVTRAPPGAYTHRVFDKTPLTAHPCIRKLAPLVRVLDRLNNVLVAQTPESSARRCMLNNRQICTSADLHEALFEKVGHPQPDPGDTAASASETTLVKNAMSDKRPNNFLDVLPEEIRCRIVVLTLYGTSLDKVNTTTPVPSRRVPL